MVQEPRFPQFLKERITTRSGFADISGACETSLL